MNRTYNGDVVRTDVFLSYAREDSEFAFALRDALHESGISVWIDESSIPTSSEFLDEIHTGIETAAKFVAILSPESVASRFCRLEADHAVKHKKRLIPIIRRSVDADKVHPELAARDWLQFLAEDDVNEKTDECIEVINSDLDHAKQAAQYLQMALDWQRNKGNLLTGAALKEAESWLTHAARKDPAPTEMHSAYVLASRQAVTRFRQRSGTAIAAALLATVALFAIWRGLAERRNSIDLFLSEDGARVHSPTDFDRKQDLREQHAQAQLFPAYSKAIGQLEERLARIPDDSARAEILTLNQRPLSFTVAPDGGAVALAFPNRVEIRSASNGAVEHTYDPAALQGRNKAEVIWMDASRTHDFFLFEVRYPHFARPQESEIFYDRDRQTNILVNGGLQEEIRGQEQEMYCGFYDGSPPLSLGRTKGLDWGIGANTEGDEGGESFWSLTENKMEVTRKQALQLRIEAGELMTFRGSSEDGEPFDGDEEGAFAIADQSVNQTDKIKEGLLKKFDGGVGRTYDEEQSFRKEDPGPATLVRQIARDEQLALYYVEKCVMSLYGRPGGFSIHPQLETPNAKPRQLLEPVLYHEKAEFLSFPDGTNDFVDQKPRYEPCAISEEMGVVILRDKLVKLAEDVPPESLVGIDFNSVEQLAFDDDGALLLFHQDGSVELYDLKTRRVMHKFAMPANTDFPVRVARSSKLAFVLSEWKRKQPDDDLVRLESWEMVQFGADGWGGRRVRSAEQAEVVFNSLDVPR